MNGPHGAHPAPDVSPARLAAFSDGVIAIVGTVMVLELHVPRAPTAAGLAELAPVFLAYALSYAVVAAMWVNHHHQLQGASRVTTGLLWANVYLLFWMSLIPVATRWLDAAPGAPVPLAAYALDLALCATGFALVRGAVARQLRADGAEGPATAPTPGRMRWALPAYVAAAALAFVWPPAAYAVIAAVPAFFLRPEVRARRRHP